MRLKNLIIDGFKSYAHRTEIGPFDAKFNAITGFNGSGKSNILDAICFVLGISTLSQVRVSRLQELVYKQGQGGTKKATVSLIFDNTDKSTSPPGYAECDEITVTRSVAIGGRNKYLINGHNAQLKQVEALFHSVSLNVNNPHFLIMQGRITKVLNMKPPEVLSLLGEAAGTRQYDVERARTLKTFEKKSRKVETINSVLSDEIEPKLQQLRAEQKAYERWMQLRNQVDTMRRYIVALQYHRAAQQIGASDGDASALVDERSRLEQAIAEATEARDDAAQQLDTLQRKKADEVDEQLAALESDEARLSKLLVEREGSLGQKRETLESEQRALDAHKRAIDEANAALEKKHAQQQQHGKKNDADDDDDNSVAECERRVELIERRYAAAQSGGGDVGGDDAKSMAELLDEAQRSVAAARSEAKQSAMRAKHARSQAEEKRARVSSVDAKTTALQRQHAEAVAKLSALCSELAELDKAVEEAAADDDATNSGAASKQRVLALRQRVADLDARLAPALAFNYARPAAKFDDRQVHGPLAALTMVRDPAHATALEVAAGGKLRSVVVDNDQVAKALLTRGKLQRRVTFVPLNRVRSHVVEPRRVARAKQIAGARGSRCELALALVDARPAADAARLAPAMQYAFGSTLVCDDMETAKAVTFDAQVRQRSVTLLGDVFSPSGTLTGGSRRTGGGALLAQVRELAELRELLAEASLRLDAEERAAAEARRQRARRDELRKRAELAEHEATLLKQQIDRCPQQQLLNEIEALERDAEALAAREHECAATVERDSARIAELQQCIADAAAQRESILRNIEVERQRASKALAAAKRAARDAAQRAKQLELECAALREELEQLHGARDASLRQLDTLAEEVARRAEALEAARAEHSSVAARLGGERQRALECSRELASLDKRRRAADKQATEHGLALQRVQHRIGQHEARLGGARATVEQLLAEHPWIESERQYFGVRGTNFDFAAAAAAAASSSSEQAEATRLAKLEAEHAKLSKSINKKVLSMFQTADDEYNKLVDKRERLERDKAAIIKFMDDFDRKKSDALQATWRSVNRDFGNIFSTLLPGARAKLEPPEGQSVLDGLCFKVAFGAVWKESLTELSGGQRSLLALSLILALLLFKPAPMYILDEIDAALDLSHTQNIGEIIRTRFGSSQFIIVSLKEGMFTNANVLFKTKLVDGYSTVQRHTK
jgi:structural maintenance of chromosome 2